MASAPKSDADCVKSAYENAIGNLFKVLYTNLQGTPSNEKTYVANFTKGWQFAQHTKQLALGVVGSTPPKVQSARRRQKAAAR
jgi:hypothetical protein